MNCSEFTVRTEERCAAVDLHTQGTMWTTITNTSPDSLMDNHRGIPRVTDRQCFAFNFVLLVCTPTMHTLYTYQ